MSQVIQATRHGRLRSGFSDGAGVSNTQHECSGYAISCSYLSKQLQKHTTGGNGCVYDSSLQERHRELGGIIEIIRSQEASLEWFNSIRRHGADAVPNVLNV